MPAKFSIILTTTGSQAEAERIAGLLVSRKLAACVQITDITSFYTWKGKVNKNGEFLLLIKTMQHLYNAVETTILENHSYEIPEVLQIPVGQGLGRYLNWVSENTKQE